MSKALVRICLVLTSLCVCSGLAFAQEGLFLRNGSILDSLQSITESTIPANGDLNPYGVAFVPQGFPSGGSIRATSWSRTSTTAPTLRERARPS